MELPVALIVRYIRLQTPMDEDLLQQNGFLGVLHFSQEISMNNTDCAVMWGFHSNAGCSDFSKNFGLF